MPPTGLIEIQIEGISRAETERLQLILHRLIIQGILHLRNGSMSINFDGEGSMSSIEVVKRWRPSDKTPLRPVEKIVDARSTSATL